jgi:N-carbamoylputrescine amidase
MDGDAFPSVPPPFRLVRAQRQCGTDPGENLRVARLFLGRAARQKASVCGLPELLSNRYCGPFEDVESFLQGVPESAGVLENLTREARRHRLAVVAPFLERTDSGSVHNSAVVIGPDGEIHGKYRKIHLPRSEGYREDRYFRAGDLGYGVAQLGPRRIGLAICWDQWFPEVSRILALKGAPLIVYPSAIGSEVGDPTVDSHPDWEMVMRAQAIMNRVFIAAVNRVGPEERIRFYGGSFVADPWGKVLRRAGPRAPRLLAADLDLSQLTKANSFFGFLDTRAPSTYGELLARPATPSPS